MTWWSPPRGRLVYVPSSLRGLPAYILGESPSTNARQASRLWTCLHVGLSAPECWKVKR